MAGLLDIIVRSQVIFSSALAEPKRGSEFKSHMALAENLCFVPNTHTRDAQLPTTMHLLPMASEGTYRHKTTTSPPPSSSQANDLKIKASAGRGGASL